MLGVSVQQIENEVNTLIGLSQDDLREVYKNEIGRSYPRNARGSGIIYKIIHHRLGTDFTRKDIGNDKKLEEHFRVDEEIKKLIRSKRGVYGR